MAFIPAPPSLLTNRLARCPRCPVPDPPRLTGLLLGWLNIRRRKTGLLERVAAPGNEKQ
jgi:hypothetical protein